MSELTLRPLTPVVGAEVSGLDLRCPLDEREADQLQSALLTYGVLFLRGQDITPAQQLAFARQMGEISIPPIQPHHDAYPEMLVLDQVSPVGEGADEWHSDNSFMQEPPLGSILKAVQLPSCGGDTCFASMYAAYEALSEPIRQLVDGLSAIHDITKPMQRAIAAGLLSADLAEVQKKNPPVVHPVVRTHPVTGKKGLYVNGNSTSEIVGLSARENELLLRFLIDHVRDPAFQCRFTWDLGSIAFWDNRAVQHYAVADYRERRVMHRVTLKGDRPY